MSRSIKLSHFTLIVSFVNLVLFHYPFFKFVINNADISSLNGILLFVSLITAAILLNALVFYIGLYLLCSIGKWLLVLFFVINSISVYFVSSYGIIIDKSMIGNVFNTNYEESTSFLSFGLFYYIVLLGVLPGILIFKVELVRTKLKKFLGTVGVVLIFLLALVYINAPNWLWIDKNSKTLGGLVMPWSYVINTNRYFLHKSKENKKQILLPNAKVKDDKKSVFVLVIGESARSSNFSLYGYAKNTNPLLSKITNLHHYKAESCATYTTAGTKCILEHKNTGKLFEILPNYLFRNDVEVFWRTTNWGEPKVTIKNFQKKDDLQKICSKDENCNYDEVLLSGLKEQIQTSKKDKILVVLHTSTSHGPTYYKKYPDQFNKFKPVCKSVELSNCSEEELINAYDNTIVYTDYILNSLIQELKQLEAYNSSMIYISDHGESLGENNLYMHGIPASIAPKEQLEIPFIVWLSDDSKKIKKNEVMSQHHIFHSVLDFLSINSPIYDQDMSIFK
ncbi:phosphoethanolamine--lipid A transferase EptA [Aquimarina latercula]|uniref:phosphoethanolamine--lipid A transferase EptA n=1 Tax=Aquimarina latercula TaxID=987 RepID=UPI000404B6E8|nr:phosphoethanolamine--lipid A transferase EptA [Aquimarina latercula]